MSDAQKFQLGTIGALSLSVVSSVSIVICNKALISTLGFTFATTLTSWHLLVTFCSLHVALWMKFFEHKPFDPRAVLGFGVLNGISIGLLNLSLGFNSVGFYQMTKLAIIPCTVVLETIFFRKMFSRKIQFSLVILLLGVGIATVTDLQLNMLGSVLSLLAVITTCVAQIMTNTIQKKYKVSSTQLLYQSCPYQAITLFVTGPFLDGLLTNQNVFAFKYTSQVVVRMKQYMWNGLHYCFYIFTNTPCLNAVLHRLVLPHICFSKLQHVSRHWKDISCHLSGSRTSKNMLSVSIWVSFAERRIQLAQHSWYSCRRDWNGALFLLLHTRNPTEGHRNINSIASDG
ncbi:Nucleotide/sugar transporter family protein [Arabidopsis thaliana]|uniref:Nucleotide/sugar transporter family protein n=1 Tax=Arabidopsis thaliana TaxID=3702 RepID=A0A1P8B1A0_ARATH|nr:Nucleotide/sugar transporter family protein [Arabidopsis thaliana]ANM62658.1 Nucleotide/sugar transporter family protein [Arabidopsis thaliana]|eukprot:NP_001324800.1 Nucleotide/sugar transporter family protein [Arabidopsis thaliana]